MLSRWIVHGGSSLQAKTEDQEEMIWCLVAVSLWFIPSRCEYIYWRQKRTKYRGKERLQQSARRTHSLLTSACAMWAAVGGTLQISVGCVEASLRRPSWSKLLAPSSSEGAIDFWWTRSQRGSHESRCFIYIVRTTLLASKERDWSSCFLLETECCYKASRVSPDITVRSSLASYFVAFIGLT